MIANTLDMDIKPGSMGKSSAGNRGGRRQRREDGTVTPCKPGEIGDLAIKTGWPSMMRAYLHEEARYKKTFAGGWYISGDLAMQRSGRLFLVRRPGRRPDQVFRSPDRAVRGRKRPDRARGGGRGRRHRPAGRDRRRGGQGLCLAQSGFRAVRGAGEIDPRPCPQEARPSGGSAQIEFRKTLPKTRSGKIMRRLLKARELGLPEGDISTLETDES
jgi:acetyl-CoA synthetase